VRAKAPCMRAASSPRKQLRYAPQEVVQVARQGFIHHAGWSPR